MDGIAFVAALIWRLIYVVVGGLIVAAFIAGALVF